mmetsp:Transcript_14289/g.27752  ORF Transcript_14289/g.27752 Transcript_14289/m.27752 type:complete len:135 (+) Transcript_14289:2395-2799(+)
MFGYPFQLQVGLFATKNILDINKRPVLVKSSNSGYATMLVHARECAWSHQHEVSYGEILISLDFFILLRFFRLHLASSHDGVFWLEQAALGRAKYRTPACRPRLAQNVSTLSSRQSFSKCVLSSVDLALLNFPS